MSSRYNATRAALTAIVHVLEDTQPKSAELARAKLILDTDEFWEVPKPPVVPSTGSTSGEHAFSIRFRPPRAGLGDWRVVLVSALVSLLAQYLPQYLGTSAQPPPELAPHLPHALDSGEEP